MPYPQAAAAEDSAQPSQFSPFRGVDRIRAAPNHPFFLCHSPRDWEPVSVNGSTYWLPILHSLPLMGGAAGVRTLLKGETDPRKAYQHAVAERTAKGIVHLDPETALPAEFLPASVTPGPYIRSTPCRSRGGVEGVYWHEAWKLRAPSLPDEEQRWTFDREPFNKWRYHLVESGVIQAPNDLIIERNLMALRRRVGRAKVIQGAPEIRDEKVAAADAAVKAADSAAVPEKPADKPAKGGKA